MVIDYQSPARAFVDGPTGTEFASERLARQIRSFELNAAERAQRTKSGRWINLGIIAVLTAIFTLSAVAGLSRAEMAYQTDRRV